MSSSNLTNCVLVTSFIVRAVDWKCNSIFCRLKKWMFLMYEGESNETLKYFYLLIYWTRKRHNDFIFLCSILLPPVGHSSNQQYHCWNSQDSRAVVRIFIALLRFSVDSPPNYINRKNSTNTARSRNNSHILKGNKNQTKQGTQKILLLIKSIYNAVF